MAFYENSFFGSKDLAFISATLLAGIGFVFILFLKSSKKTWKFFVQEQKMEFSYGLMGLTSLLDDVVSREKNKVEFREFPNKVAVITGGTRGIGKEVVKMLLQCKIHVVIGCRNLEAGNKMLACFKEKGIPVEKCAIYNLDVSSFNSVKEFANIVRAKFPKIHYLINNAGIMFGPYRESVDGFELQLATNYLGHFMLTHLLLENIKAAGSDLDFARIVNVTSCAHLLGEINFQDLNKKDNYIPSAAYCDSKLAQVLFTKHLDKILKETKEKVEVFSVHPGIVDTDIFDGTMGKKIFPWLIKLTFKTPIQGAYPIVFTCISDKLHGRGGFYIRNCEIVPSKDTTFIPEYQEKLFELTKKLLNIEIFGKIN